ncbi:hypothetical protein FPRO06_12696 [Fusarium proliferatum]|nr:hypothetical protein FPRO06_12696 [Fusarium proliferatum]
MRGPAPRTFPQRDTTRAPLKRTLDTNAQAPISASEPKRLQRSSSFISIPSSSDEDEAPKAKSSSRAKAKSSPQQPKSNKNTMANFLAMGKQKPSQTLQQRPQQIPAQKPQHKPSQTSSQVSSQAPQKRPQQIQREILLPKTRQLEQEISELRASQQASQRISRQIPQQVPQLLQQRPHQISQQSSHEMPPQRSHQWPQQILQQTPQQFLQEALRQYPRDVPLHILQHIQHEILPPIPQQPQPMPLLPSNPSTSGPADNESEFLEVDVVHEPTLCKEQQDLLDLIMSGRNVFFTGSAGCGKSTVLKATVKKLRAAGKIVHITAPTGRAALGVNSVTTWSYMG